MSRRTSSLFTPTTEGREAKGDTTSKAARSIMNAEVAARDAKTARLKAARLALEAEAPAAAPAKAATKKKK